MPVRKEKFRKLHEIGDERIAELDALLGKGVLPSELATKIQNDWGFLTDLKHDSVKKMLERYRKSELREKVVAQITGVTRDVRTKTLQRRLNAMEELQELVEIQKGRYRKLLVKEQQGPLLLKQVTDEGKLLKEMLVELGKLQLETGLLVRAPKKMTGVMTDEDGNIHHFSWTEEQEELAQILEVSYERVD